MQQLDFRGLADRLLADADRLLAQWLPKGKRQGTEYKAGYMRNRKPTPIRRMFLNRPL